MVRASLAGILNDLKVPSSEVFLLQLAVSEIVSNAIEHGYAGLPGHQVDVAVHIVGPEVSVDVSDDAPAFPGNELLARLQEQEPDTTPDDTWPTRGHGLQIAKQVVDSLSFSRTGDRNCVTLVKQVSVNSPASTDASSGIGIE
jgi:anti-sigma regulatory factor (Ser/Thr protein kinase)